MHDITIKHFLRIPIILSSLFLILLSACVTPVTPEFQLEEGLLFVEGFVSTAEGASFVRIGKSDNDFGLNRTIFQQNAQVLFINEETDEQIALVEAEDAYVPPSGFRAIVGESWRLDITLENKTHLTSTPEKVLQPIPIANVTSAYNPKLRLNRNTSEFEPGHDISVTFDDPGNTSNYYYWSYRSFESQTVCATCFDGILREGNCTPASLPPPYYYTYFCETECWKIRYPTDISIYEDKFSNGNTTKDLKIGEVPLYNKKSILIELQQFSLTPTAYEYFKVLNDIIDNAGGLNSPPPAALVGNIINTSDPENYIYGRFTAASASVASLYIDRSGIMELPIESELDPKTEPQIGSPYPPPITITAPCSETQYRTANTPDGWQ